MSLCVEVRCRTMLLPAVRPAVASAVCRRAGLATLGFHRLCSAARLSARRRRVAPEECLGGEALSRAIAMNAFVDVVGRLWHPRSERRRTLVTGCLPSRRRLGNVSCGQKTSNSEALRVQVGSSINVSLPGKALNGPWGAGNSRFANGAAPSLTQVPNSMLLCHGGRGSAPRRLRHASAVVGSIAPVRLRKRRQFGRSRLWLAVIEAFDLVSGNRRRASLLAWCRPSIFQQWRSRMRHPYAFGCVPMS